MGAQYDKVCDGRTKLAALATVTVSWWRKKEKSAKFRVWFKFLWGSALFKIPEFPYNTESHV